MNWRIATFNANSIRTRLRIVIDWISRHEPDALCIQETKVQDAQFPVGAFQEAKYHVVYHGQKSYNGVAVATRRRPAEVRIGFQDGGDDSEARFILLKVDGVFVINTYVPQGREPGTEFFQAKLDFLGRIKRLLEKTFSPDDPLIWAGDFNVAPEPRDVFDPKRLAGHVGFHPDEHRAFQDVKEWGFEDVFRLHNSEPGQFTFWDYRLPKAFERNLGWRLDHIWATRPLAERSRRAWIDVEPRTVPKPSDHTFLAADFNIEEPTS